MTLRLMRGFTGIVNDNLNLALEVESLQLPTYEEITETYQPGGSDMEIEITGLGVKAFTLPMKLKTRNPAVVGLFGGAPGIRQRFTGKTLVIDEADGSEHEHAVDISGRLASAKAQDMQGGKAAGYDFEWKGIWLLTEYWDQRPMHRFNFQLGGWDMWNFQPVSTARRSVLFS